MRRKVRCRRPKRWTDALKKGTKTQKHKKHCAFQGGGTANSKHAGTHTRGHWRSTLSGRMTRLRTWCWPMRGGLCPLPSKPHRTCVVLMKIGPFRRKEKQGRQDITNRRDFTYWHQVDVCRYIYLIFSYQIRITTICTTAPRSPPRLMRAGKKGAFF